jgi:hypothetical protein
MQTYAKTYGQKGLLLSENGRKLEETTRGFEECKEQLIIRERAEATQKIAGFRIRVDLMRNRIRIQHFFLLRIRIPDPDPSFFPIADPDPGFDDLKLKKIRSWKFNFYFLDQKLLFTYPKASIKDAQATEEAFSPQKRTSST